MDELIKSIIVQSPMVAVLLFAIKTIYLDMRADRDKAANERSQLAKQLAFLTFIIQDCLPAGDDNSLWVMGDDGEIVRKRKNSES